MGASPKGHPFFTYSQDFNSLKFFLNPVSVLRQIEHREMEGKAIAMKTNVHEQVITDEEAIYQVD